jgi:hypothetical protein
MMSSVVLEPPSKKPDHKKPLKQLISLWFNHDVAILGAGMIIYLLQGTNFL